MQDLYLPVEKLQCLDIFPDFIFPSNISHCIVTTLPTGEKRILQYCSDLYHLVPNESIIPVFKEKLSKYYKVEESYRTWNYSRFRYDLTIKDYPIEVGRDEKDPIFPRVSFDNSYDGSKRFNFTMGFQRKVCTNGMTVPYGEEQKVLMRHTPQLDKEMDLSKVLEMTSEFLKVQEDFTEYYQELRDQSVGDWMERVEEVIDETSFPLALQEDVNYRINQELESIPGMEPSDWLVYNAFNYQLNHNDGFQAKLDKKEKIDHEILNYLISY